ncbi:hypothetical protein MKW94_015628 [Papaver nudicaule]|uniref:Translation initiation factor IF-2, chloroplastic n=1 Tax=Papaver nudicaule TaxID=74823 RepID=A0AA41VM34_PAPNU|nr:hypothetical protein [Papaver nudicaule]
MASLASLASLGSLRPSSSCYFEGSSPLLRRISLKGGVSFVNCPNRQKWNCASVCKCMVTTASFVAEQGNSSISLDSTLRDENSAAADLVLKPAPKPVLQKAPPRLEPPPPRNSVYIPPKKSSAEKAENLEDRNKVIESLGEVLEKAEKLETPSTTGRSSSGSGSSSASAGVGARPAASARTTSSRPVTPVANRKAKTLKSVWRKGNPVASVQKVVETPKITVSEKDEGAKTEEAVKPAVQPSAQPPLRVQPMLQSRPAVAPPTPAIKKPVILKDVGAAPRPQVAAEKETVTAERETAPKTKERKPILIDKFASKRAASDPMMAQAVLAPPKPGKNPASAKFKDEQRKRPGAPLGSRRRMSSSDIPDDDASLLNLKIKGAARKGRKWSKASRKAARLQAAADAAPVKVEILEVEEDGMSTEELSFNLAISEGEILGFMYSKGIKPDGVQKLDRDMVKMVCKEYEVEVIDAAHVGVEEKAKKNEIFDEEDLDKLEDRPPVLTIMGHVDHGKTTLLDYIRKSKVTASEAGGITQGIGAYKVLVPVDGKPQPCVFLDTPGHEAFGAMRARGARVTDIAIIVVAADDGVRPQTNEAIAHAKAAGVPIVVAINKIDKDGASPERVMQELSSIGLMPEDWGGDVPMVQISALKGENVDDLLETVMLVAELQELKANPHRNAKGTVIEAGLHKSKGPVATLIVQKGTLKRGDVIVCGEAFGKVSYRRHNLCFSCSTHVFCLCFTDLTLTVVCIQARALFDDSGAIVDKAGPSTAVQVLGFSTVPVAGDEFEVVDSLDTAREKAETRAVSLRDERISSKAGDGMVTLSSLAAAVSAGKQAGIDLHQLNVVMKVDLQGSIEAIRQALQVLPQDNVTLKFLLQATGDISASDVDLAVAAGKAIIIGFNVKVSNSVKSHADNKGVEIRLYKVIYELIDDMRKAMEGLLDPVEEQIPIGTAEIRQVFSSGSGRVAGCMITDGKIVKGCGIRVLRKGKPIHVGVVDSLRRVKEVVKEVNAGLECGVGIDDYTDWEAGDTIEAFNSVQKQRSLEEASTSMAAAISGEGY